MKTAEEIIIKHTGARYWESWDLWKKEAVIKAMEEYRQQSHPSPMSAEQELWKVGDKTNKGVIDVVYDQQNLSIAGKFYNTLNHNIELIQPPMSAEQVCRWVKASERLPEIGMVILVKYFNTYQELYYKNNVWFVKGTNLVAYSECFSLQLEWLETFATTPSVKADGWVSVEDGLPEDGEDVLCISKSINCPVLSNYNNSAFEVKKYPCPSDRVLIAYWEDVTHWQPLPNPPKQQL